MVAADRPRHEYLLIAHATPSDAHKFMPRTSSKNHRFKEAENAERTKSVATCQALIHATIEIGVEEQVASAFLHCFFATIRITMNLSKVLRVFFFFFFFLEIRLHISCRRC